MWKSSSKLHPVVVASGFCVLGVLPLLTGCGSGGSSSAAPINNPPATQYTASFREFAVPVAGNAPTDPFPGSWPDDIAYDASGDIWFGEHHSDEIGELIPNGNSYQYRGYPVPTTGSLMDSIAVDSQRKLVWVSEVGGNKVARLDLNVASPQATEINVTTLSHANPEPGDLAIDASGNLWYTTPYEGDKAPNAGVGRIERTTNAVTEFHVPTQPNGLDGLTFDSAGTLWCVEIASNKIAHLVNGSFTEINLPRPNVVPTNIAVASNGIVWVSEQDPSGNAIAAFNPADTTGHPWRELPVPTPNSLPSGLTVDQKGNVWFTEFNTSKIGVVPAGSSSVLDFSIPTANSGPEDVRAAPDGRIFFTEQYGNKIGQITVPNLTP